MPQPTAGDVHVNAPLTNISIAYLQNQDEFVSDKVFPNLPVQKESNLYFTYPKQQWFRSDAQKRGPSTESAGSGYEIDSDSYFCEVYGLHKDIDDRVRANADQPINPDREATTFVSRGLALRREKDWASKYFVANIWTGSSTGADITPTTKWGVSGSVPITDLRTQIYAMKKKTGFRPNTLILPDDVWAVLQDNADFTDRISIGRDKILTKDFLAQILEIPRVFIAGAVEDTANEGATAAMNWLYSNQCLLVYAAPTPSLMHPSAGYTFSWNGYLGAGGQGQRIKRFRMEEINSDRVEGEMTYDQKIVAPDLGVFFTNVLS
jgi:hypothetical protein